MPTRIEINVKTGERKEIELTPEENSDAQARTAKEASDRAIKEANKKPTLEERVTALEEKIK